MPIHKTITGGAQYLPFALTKLRALAAFAAQQGGIASRTYQLPDALIRLAVIGDQQFLALSGDPVQVALWLPGTYPFLLTTGPFKAGGVVHTIPAANALYAAGFTPRTDPYYAGAGAVLALMGSTPPQDAALVTSGAFSTYTPARYTAALVVHDVWRKTAARFAGDLLVVDGTAQLVPVGEAAKGAATTALRFQTVTAPGYTQDVLRLVTRPATLSDPVDISALAGLTAPLTFIASTPGVINGGRGRLLFMRAATYDWAQGAPSQWPFPSDILAPALPEPVLVCVDAFAGTAATVAMETIDPTARVAALWTAQHAAAVDLAQREDEKRQYAALYTAQVAAFEAHGADPENAQKTADWHAATDAVDAYLATLDWPVKETTDASGNPVVHWNYSTTTFTWTAPTYADAMAPARQAVDDTGNHWASVRDSAGTTRNTALINAEAAFHAAQPVALVGNPAMVAADAAFSAAVLDANAALTTALAPERAALGAAQQRLIIDATSNTALFPPAAANDLYAARKTQLDYATEVNHALAYGFLAYSGKGHVSLSAWVQYEHRLYLSADHGATWTQAAHPACHLERLTALYSLWPGQVEFTTRQVMASNGRTYVNRYTSADHGATWTVSSVRGVDVGARGAAGVLKTTPRWGVARIVRDDAGHPVSTEGWTFTGPTARNRTAQFSLSAGVAFGSDPARVCVLGSRNQPAPLLPGHPGALEFPPPTA